MDLEDIWRVREEDIYPALFGASSGSIYPLTGDLFTGKFRQETYDPRWLFHGVFQFPPISKRESWLYVTSGYSNPWEEDPSDYSPEGESGAGVEFVFQTTESGEWAIQALQNMLAFDMLLAAGCFPNGKPLGFGDRVPLRSPINGDEACQIRNVIMTEPEGIPAEFVLPSGKVIFASFTGITNAERDFCKEAGSDKLIERLRVQGAHPITNPNRQSIV